MFTFYCWNQRLKNQKWRYKASRYYAGAGQISFCQFHFLTILKAVSSASRKEAGTASNLPSLSPTTSSLASNTPTLCGRPEWEVEEAFQWHSYQFNSFTLSSYVVAHEILWQWTIQRECWELLALSNSLIRLKWKKKLPLLACLQEALIMQEPR